MIVLHETSLLQWETNSQTTGHHHVLYKNVVSAVEDWVKLKRSWSCLVGQPAAQN